MKKILSFSLFFVSFCFLFILNVKAMTVWKYEDWQAGTNYGSKTKVSSNITNLKGEKEEDEGMKKGPFNKASKAKLSDGIKEEVFVGLNKDNYENGELFELSIAINKKEANKDAEYLTEAIVMTQKSGDKFVITAGWNKENNPIATIDTDGVYTYRWEFKKDDNKIKVRFTVLDYGKEIGATDFIELKVDDASNASDVRYLCACNIKAVYGVDIYTTLPPKPVNPDTSDINVFLYVGLAIISGIGLFCIKKRILN